MAIVPSEPGVPDSPNGRNVDGMHVLDVSTVFSALRAVKVLNGDRPGRTPLD